MYKVEIFNIDGEIDVLIDGRPHDKDDKRRLRDVARKVVENLSTEDLLKFVHDYVPNVYAIETEVPKNMPDLKIVTADIE